MSGSNVRDGGNGHGRSQGAGARRSGAVSVRLRGRQPCWPRLRTRGVGSRYDPAIRATNKWGGSVSGAIGMAVIVRCNAGTRGGAELGIFGDRLAKTADHAALAKAESSDLLARYSSPPLDSHGILARANEAGYAPKPKPARSFEKDYREPVEGVGGSRLQTDIEGRPLTAKFVAGRRAVGGDDVDLTPAEVTQITREVGSVDFVRRSSLPRRAVGSCLPTLNAIKIAADLPPDQAAIALSHELGHALADNARVPLSLEGNNVALTIVYHDRRSVQLAHLVGMWQSWPLGSGEFEPTTSEALAAFDRMGGGCVGLWRASRAGDL